MIGPDVAKLLESGTSTVVGTVDPEGAPDASRAWGAWTLDGGARVRLLVPSTDERALANLRANGRIAVTATDVDTLESVQVKGRAVVVEPATADDRAFHDRYREEFFRNVNAADGSPIEALRNMTPSGVTAVELVVETAFDQTPGPTAGRCLA